MNIWFCVSHHLSCFYSQPNVPALFDIFALCLSVRLSCFSNCPFLCLRPPLSHFLLSRFNGLRPFFFITQVCLLSLHSFQSLMLWIIFCCPRRRDIWKRERVLCIKASESIALTFVLLQTTTITLGSFTFLMCSFLRTKLWKGFPGPNVRSCNSNLNFRHESSSLLGP